MRRSKSEIYVHLVWTTQQRQPLITPEVRERLYAFIEMQAKHLGCSVLASGGMPDHVHFIVRLPTKISVAQLLKIVKGSSSAFMNDITQRTPYFRWQEGAGSFSLCQPFLADAIRYVENQERHHTIKALWPKLEETDEDIPLVTNPNGSSRP